MKDYNELAGNTMQGLKSVLRKIEQNKGRIILTSDFDSAINWEAVDAVAKENA